MLEIRNTTPFKVALIPALNKEGVDLATVVVKGTFSLATGASKLPVAEDQAAIAFGDEYHGDPGTTSIKYASDVTPARQGTDIGLVGHACVARGQAQILDVSLQVGPLKKSLRVFGDRVWEKFLGSVRMSPPKPFDRMPLVYERAFGGKDTSDPNPSKHAFDQRNPVGVGFLAPGRSDRVDGLAAPNVEDPGQLVRGPADHPAPTGFGFIAPSWMPRKDFAGTYDETWEREKKPFLPDDFDERFFQGAHHDLISPQPLQGGEVVRATNVSSRGQLTFELPRQVFEIKVLMKGQESTHLPRLNTILIEPDENRLCLTWAASFPCPRAFLYIDLVRVRERS